MYRSPFSAYERTRWFEKARSWVIRKLLTQRFRYFVTINEVAMATAKRLPADHQGGIPALPLDWVLRNLRDGGANA